MLTQAIRFVAAKGARSPPTIQLVCHVKPGVSANREGITAVSKERIEVCVAAQAREGEANRAVRDVIASALKVSKSDVELVKGLKGREKTVAVVVHAEGIPEEEIQRIKIMLLESVSR